MSRPERKPRPARDPWAKWINVTISLEARDLPLLKVLCARYKVKSTSHALRCAVREVAAGELPEWDKDKPC